MCDIKLKKIPFVPGKGKWSYIGIKWHQECIPYGFVQLFDVKCIFGSEFPNDQSKKKTGMVPRAVVSLG